MAGERFMIADISKWQGAMNWFPEPLTVFLTPIKNLEVIVNDSGFKSLSRYD